MHVTISYQSLLAAAKRVAPVVPKRATVPVIESFRISPLSDSILIVGTDLDNWITTKAPAIAVQTPNATSACVNAKSFMSALKALDSKYKAQVITLTADNQELTLQSEGITQKLAVTGSDLDYPTMPACASPVVDLTQEQLQALTTINFATAHYDTSSILGCVNLEVN